MVNVISKSGTTTEPSVAFRVIKEFMERKFVKKNQARESLLRPTPIKALLESS